MRSLITDQSPFKTGLGNTAVSLYWTNCIDILWDGTGARDSSESPNGCGGKMLHHYGSEAHRLPNSVFSFAALNTAIQQ
jgi:hypothetical protein